jgi:hypothetical protein
LGTTDRKRQVLDEFFAGHDAIASRYYYPMDTLLEGMVEDDSFALRTRHLLFERVIIGASLRASGQPRRLLSMSLATGAFER